jgi:Holliday junction resolvasome RuvABC ATP-dependent DNA helicase subunit
MKIDTKTLFAPFEGIIGQTRIVQTLQSDLLAYCNGGNLHNYMFAGLAGLGKTKLVKAYGEALNEAARQQKMIGASSTASLYYATPQEFRKMGNEYNTLAEAFMTMRPLFLQLDEVHELYIRETTQSQRIHQVIKKAADRESFVNGEASVRWDDDSVFQINKRNFCLTIATNFPEKMKDAAAMHSRFQTLTLDLMTEEELTQVLMGMLSARSIRACEETIGIIARCGRGTCRPLEKIVDALETRILSTGKTTRTVNKADVIAVMAQLLLFPRGLSRTECRILDRCKDATGSKMDHLALAYGVEVAEIRKSVSYLESQRFCGWRGSYVVTSDKGARYLADITAAGLKF